MANSPRREGKENSGDSHSTPLYGEERGGVNYVGGPQPGIPKISVIEGGNGQKIGPEEGVDSRESRVEGGSGGLFLHGVEARW